MTKKRIGRPPKSPSNRSTQITLTTRGVVALDRLILSALGPLAGPMKQASEQAQRRRDFLSALIQDEAPKVLVDLKRSFEDQVSRLTGRVESVETPYLDFVGEVLLLKDSVANIEHQYDRRLAALEPIEK